MSTTKASKPLVPKDHLTQAIHNEELARGLIALKTPYCDWAITSIFYAALHYLYYKISPPTILNSHDALENEIMKIYPANSKVWSIYKKLKNRGVISRYYPHLAVYMSNDKVLVENILKQLNELKKELGI